MLNCINTNTTYLTSEESDCEFTKQHIFISGSIAVGKTTVMKCLNEYLHEREDIKFIKEYIDYNADGEKYLEKLHNGEISNYQFQLYVIQCYDKQLNTIDYEESDVVIWERHPLEALDIFCKEDITLTDKERLEIILRIETLCDKYKIPQLIENNINYISIDTNSFRSEQISYFIISEIIYQMLLGEYENNVLILLFCSNIDEQFNRIIKRGRSIELKKYKISEDLLKINNNYFEFFLKRKDSQLK